MASLTGLLRSVIASHKTVYASIATSAVSVMLTALVTQISAGEVNWKAVGMAGLSVILTTLAGYSKSPATPKAAPPDPPPENETQAKS